MFSEKNLFGDLRSILAQPWTPQLNQRVTDLLARPSATRSLISYLSGCLPAWMVDSALGRYYLRNTPYAHPIFAHIVQWRNVQVFLNPWCRSFERTSWETYLRAEAYRDIGRGRNWGFEPPFEEISGEVASGYIAPSRVEMSVDLFNSLRTRVTPIAPMDKDEYRAYTDTNKVEESERIYGCQMQFPKASLPFNYLSTPLSRPPHFVFDDSPMRFVWESINFSYMVNCEALSRLTEDG